MVFPFSIYISTKILSYLGEKQHSTHTIFADKIVNFIPVDVSVDVKTKKSSGFLQRILSEKPVFKPVQEMGLEPTRSHPRQILSLMRLPFRHSCASNSVIIPQVLPKCKKIILQALSVFFQFQSSQRLQSNHSVSLLFESTVQSHPLSEAALQNAVYHYSYIP